MVRQQQVAGVKFALLGLAALALDLGPTATAFPSIFGRSPLFRRQQQPPAASAQPAQPAPMQEPLLPLANSFAPLVGAHFGQASAVHPAELMRIGTQQQQQQQLALASQALGQQFEAQAAAYYKPSVATAAAGHLRQAQPLQQQQQQQVRHQLQLQPMASYLEPAEPSYQPLEADSVGPSRGRLHYEPSHTSEVVDKIEQHIGQQIEQSLKEEAKPAASGYQQKEAVAGAEASEPAEEVGGGGGEAEKRNEEPAKEEQQHHHHQHHEEHPPEAFEVHHKKGGKSFQYFHQGHSH